jgi:hypothetical protein
VYTAQLPSESFFGFKSGYLPFEQQTFWPSPNLEQRSVLVLAFMKSAELIPHFEASVPQLSPLATSLVLHVPSELPAGKVLGKVPMLQQIFSSFTSVLQRLRRLSFWRATWVIPHRLATAEHPSPDWTVVVLQSALMLRRDLDSRRAGVVLFAALVVLVLFIEAPTGPGTRRSTFIHSSLVVDGKQAPLAQVLTAS